MSLTILFFAQRSLQIRFPHLNSTQKRRYIVFQNNSSYLSILFFPQNHWLYAIEYNTDNNHS